MTMNRLASLCLLIDGWCSCQFYHVLIELNYLYFDGIDAIKTSFSKLCVFFSFVDQTDHLSAFHTLHFCVMWYCEIYCVFALTLH